MANTTLIRTIEEAPITGAPYARQDGSWIPIEGVDLGNYSFEGLSMYSERNDKKQVMYVNPDATNTPTGGVIELGIYHGLTKIAAQDRVELSSGEVTAPSLTTALIDSGDDKTLTTKEWVQSNLSSGGISDAPNNGLPYIRKSEDWSQPKIVSSGISSTGVGVQIEDASAENSYTIPAATTTTAGVMTAQDKVDLASLGQEIASEEKILIKWSQQTSGIWPPGGFYSVDETITVQDTDNKDYSVSFTLRDDDAVLYPYLYNIRITPSITVINSTTIIARVRIVNASDANFPTTGSFDQFSLNGVLKVTS